MTIEAKIIADSESPDGIRLTTFQLRYPRFIHAELMTHRVFSRNASSSRAIPVAKMIEDLRRDPAMPVYWGTNKPGMQAGEELEGGHIASPRSFAQMIWLSAMEDAIDRAQALIDLGLHKQIANRILEPWAHINVVVTATDWENFFTLRRHESAQPEIKELAERMFAQMAMSIPGDLQPGEWHLPYITKEDWSAARHHQMAGRITRDEPMYDELADKVLKKVSVARCARVSYLTHDGRQTTVEEDLALYERLVGSQPLHASPAEHQATPDNRHCDLKHCDEWSNPEVHGNFRGWIQYRKTLPGEFVAG